jgi:hypothetical protein
MDMHIAHRREHQLTAGIIAGQEASGWLMVVERDDFAVGNLEGLPLGTSVYYYAIFILKAAFQQDIIEIVVGVVGADDLLVVAGRRGYRALIGVNDGCGGGKQGGGGDHFSALAEKFATAIVFIHGSSFFFLFICSVVHKMGAGLSAQRSG